LSVCTRPFNCDSRQTDKEEGTRRPGPGSPLTADLSSIVDLLEATVDACRAAGLRRDADRLDRARVVVAEVALGWWGRMAI
jgi:hypothetical protein